MTAIKIKIYHNNNRKVYVFKVNLRVLIFKERFIRFDESN